MDFHARRPQPCRQLVFSHPQILCQLFEIVVAQAQTVNHSVLEGRAVHISQKLLGGLDGLHQLLSRANPADLPACNRKSLACRANCHRALRHLREGGDRQMLAFKDDVLVYLVCHHQQIVLGGEAGDVGKLISAEDFACGIMGRVEKDQTSAVGDGCLQILWSEAVVGRAQWHAAAVRPGHGDSGGVAVVIGFKDDHLVAEFAQSQQRSSDGFGRACGDEHFGVGIKSYIVEAFLVLGHGQPQIRNADAGRILIMPRSDGCDSGIQDFWRPVGVGEALP